MREIPVLLYHNIGHYPKTMMEDGILPETFEFQMKFFSENEWNIVTLEQAISHLTGSKKLPSNSLALTFNGGYKDAFTNVFPILKKYHLNATFFIPPETIGGTRLINGEAINCMDLEDLKKLQGNGMKIGLLAHGGWSIRNENYNEEAIKKSVTAGVEKLHNEMAFPIEYCAFKEGVPKPPLWAFLKKQGFRAVFTQCPTNRKTWIDGIGRIQIDDDDQNIFYTKISKTYLFFKDRRTWKYIRKYKIDRVAHHISETWNRVKGE